MKAKALITFIKNPVKGMVKTRLAADVGDDQALLIYLELMRHTREVAQQIDAHRLLYYSSHIDREDAWPVEVFDKRVQPSGDLGQRMETAFREALAKAEAAIIIGSDCASLTPDIVNQAFEKLAAKDVVLGPALDGGYYLLGMKQPHDLLFRNMIWSTDQVFTQTTRRIEKAGLSYDTVATLSDIDYAEDWEKYGWPI
jgi:uncharacterized protein